MAAVDSPSTVNMDNLERSLCDFSGSIPLDQRFRSLFTIKGLAATSDAHMQRAISVISTAFEDDSALLKHELAYVLGQLQDARALPTLKRVLEDLAQDAMVRHEAAEAMGAISDPSVLPVLEQYKQDKDVSVRETCELAISKITFDNSQEGKALKQSRDQAKIAQETSGLGGVESAFKPIDPAPAMTPLQAAKNEAENVTYDATQVPLFRSTLLDTSLSLFERYRAMFALRNVAHHGGQGAIKAVLALAEGLKDGSALFRHEICFVFGELCHPASIPSMITVLNDDNEHEMVRHEAAEALGGIVEESEESKDEKSDFSLVIQTLNKWAQDMNAPRVVRESCVVALDELKYNNDPTQFHRVDVPLAAA
ncbi:probable Deoxyhypusine hydroxylase [Melanopsichium pennsylvanicum]|uniref:Deoxyhypusine hydroxylase n=2 Tax=Melanopsichium pennsylvanicum TaxID=63383 RepID=A0AAJ5C2L6_9BASI|nr:mfbc-like protein [Melanopsichium pennsylvanicum 4]SNX81632.1 probable Deoxyhypusine hydroxylase [Melanopsichium pennsylvanicum]